VGLDRYIYLFITNTSLILLAIFQVLACLTIALIVLPNLKNLIQG